MPALHLFGRRTLLGGDDLHVPALASVAVRFIQLSCLVLPLGVFVWKQALVMIVDETDDSNSNSNKNSNSNFGGSEWPVWTYLFDWWGELEATAAAAGQDENSCTESIFARYYPLLSTLHLVCTVLFCVYSLFLEYHIWYWSCQGTPTKRIPRTENVQELLEKKLGICTVLLALIVGSTYFFAALFFARPYHRCFDAILDSGNDGNIDDDFGDDATDGGASYSGIEYWVGSPTWYALGALLAISQTTEVVIAALFYARLKSAEDTTTSTATATATATANEDRAGSQLHAVHHELIEELWADRCQALFRCLSISTCFLFGGRDLVDNAQRNNSYQHVAQALADYLETKGTLDVVPTDLFTGLFVLQRIQRQRILQTRKIVSLRASAIGLGLSSSNRGFALSTSSEIFETPHESSVDNNYHPIASPDITKAGLRSRVASLNDLRARNVGKNSTLTPKRPLAASSNSDDLPRSTNLSVTEITPAVPLSPSSSLIRPPLPPSQHLQLTQGLRQQQQGQQDIYRRNTTDLLHSPLDNHNETSFYRTTSRQVLNPCDATDASALEEGARMCKYALSIYTWMLYVFVNPITGFSRLACPCGSEPGVANCCRSCCCKICGIMKDCNSNSNSNTTNNNSSNSNSNSNNNNPSQTQESMTLRRRSSREPLYSESGATSANSPRHSSDGTEVDIESDNYYFDDCGDSSFSGDTFCEWHKKALLLVAGIPDADLVYAEFNNKLSSVPYCILLDHEHSLVVLSIRGSLSLEDIVTDTLVLPESLEEIGNRYGFDGSGQYCHAGVLACFDNVLRDLQKHRLLERLLDEQYPEYSLRIVGHSLGAGVCPLLGYVLRPRYPSLKVFSFSPPGCTMTWELATGCQAFATTFVLDGDIVPRLSVLALEDLRDEVLELIGRIKVPKHQVFKNFFKARESQRRGCFFGGSGSGNKNNDSGGNGNFDDYDDDLEELTEIINETLDEVPSDSKYQRQLLDFLSVQDERRATRGDTNSRSLRLYPPGKMIHLVRTGEESGCSHLMNQCLTCCTSNSGFVYTPVYISNDDLDEIVVTATMGSDHFIDRMCDELHTLSESFGSETRSNNGREAVAAAYPCGLGGAGPGRM